MHQRTACKNREKILTNKAFKGLVAKQIRQIERDLTALETKAMSELKAHPEFQERFDILKTIPGISPTTALSPMITMPELGTLSEEKVSALAGLAPMDRQSDTYQGKAHIRGWRSSVRQALFMPALVALRYNPDLKTFYERLTEAGKPKKVAVTAVMRKLIVTANALIRERREWLPN